MYYRNAQAALVVYDLTKPSSLVKARHWVAELQRQASPGIVIALVGNKVDLCAEATDEEDEEDQEAEDADGDAGDEGAAGQHEGDARKVRTKEAKQYAETENLLFFETSAKSGVNVNEVFTAIAGAIPEASLKGPRGGAAGASARAGTGGDAAARSDSRVNLGVKPDAGPKEGCAC